MSYRDAFENGLVAAKSGRKLLARIQFKTAVEHEPENWAARLWLAWCADSPDDAIEQAEHARKLSPDSQLVRQFLKVCEAFRDFELPVNAERTAEANASVLEENVNTSDVASVSEEPEQLSAARLAVAARFAAEPSTKPVTDAGLETDSRSSTLSIPEENNTLVEKSTDVDTPINQSTGPQTAESTTQIDANTSAVDLPGTAMLNAKASTSQPNTPSSTTPVETDNEVTDTAKAQEAAAIPEASLSLESRTDDPVSVTTDGEPTDSAAAVTEATGSITNGETVAGEVGKEKGDEDAPATVSPGAPSVPVAEPTIASVTEEIVGAAGNDVTTLPTDHDPDEVEESAVPVDDRQTVLVVEDSPTVRKLVEMTLAPVGYRILTAENGIEAMKLLANCQPDLILLDINMPRMDGYQLCKLIKKHERMRSIPVVMLSGKDGLFDKMRGRMVGCDDYISKPFDSAELVSCVERFVYSSRLA